MAAPPSVPLGGMSLYEDLLNEGGADAGTTPATNASTADAKQPEAPKNPALRFQPIARRPQHNAKAKPKSQLPTMPSATVTTTTTVPGTTTAQASTATANASAPAPASTVPVAASVASVQPARTTFADWTNNDDYDDYDGGAPKWTQRGGRRNKKKRGDHAGRNDAYIDWDEPYDPARPTNLEAYLQSDERVAAAVDWKRVRYAHKRRPARRTSSRSRSGSGSDLDSGSDTSIAETRRPQYNAAFAPPPSYSAPSSTPSAKPDATSMPDAARVVDAPPSSAPSPIPGLVAAKAPVRFESGGLTGTNDRDMKDDDDDAGPDNDDDDDDDDYRPSFAFAMDSDAPADAPAPRANRPGQAGFAARLMNKYGWTKGTGLGANETGIVNPLRHKRVHAGPGAAGPAMGRIVGGHKKPAAGTAPSPVVVLRNMVTGIPDLAAEVADGQLVQDIGHECGEQYGRVERVYIDVPGQLVFIKFTEAVSALRAVNALNGRVFNGNAIDPSYYDADKFEAGIYE